jgi:hypothetical protein
MQGEHMRVLKILFGVVVLASAAVHAQIKVRPGQYEYTFDMDLGPGGKEAIDAVLGAAGAKPAPGGETRKLLQCVTPEDVKEMQDADSIIKFFAREMEDCEISGVKVIGNKLTYTATCGEGDSRMTMTTEMMFSGDSIAASTKGKDDKGRPISSHLTAKRVGECPK